jgi:multidrug resistance efflux pump
VTTKEKRLLRFALVIFLGIILPFQLGPMAYDFFRNYRQSIEKLHQDIERYKKLGKKAEYWKQENQQAKLERDKIKAGLLPGDNRELVGAKMQSLVRQLAQNAGIRFKSLDPPDTSLSTGEWVLVIQSMQFEAKSKTLMNFLKAVDDAQVNLAIASLNIRSRRGQLTGSIKILGFSRVPPQPENAE